MAPGTTVRDTVTPAVSTSTLTPTPTPTPTVVPTSSWWRRLRRRIGARDASVELQAMRLERLHTLLVGARAQIEKGWVCNGWWSVASRSSDTGERTVVSGFEAAMTPPGQVRGACLVGALVLAGGQRTVGRQSEVAAAVEVVYDALRESREGSGAAPEVGLHTLSAPSVRLGRVHVLTGWNDHPGRTKDEVVEVLDLAIARTVQSIMALPAAPGQRCT